ncbi:BRO-N domain-containing protein [Orbus mooreae]|uniref:BRO-N domain-containing protein n=1 Tax=Orbus mooreae TaxID=3074107 RepID=UPI00370DD006
MQNQLIFNNMPLTVTNMNNQIWLTSAELAKALQYKSAKSVTNIFNVNSDEFTSNMSQVIESVTSGNYTKKVRIFSLRGAHLIAMFSRTAIAKDFRKWVLDILDRESGVVKINDLIAHSQKQELIRTINRCVDRIKEHCNDISIHLCKNFNINQLDELPLQNLVMLLSF